ncbi:Uncharacterized protein Rs2_09742 [Raphanus sativus]|nr:Uncharacterized protein Rs2_09742 [Raphanus sativus]
MKGVRTIAVDRDLLADLVEETVDSSAPPNPESSSKLETDAISGPLDLTGLFQDNYDKLNSAFAGSDHSWTSLTLELCASLETANKLVQPPPQMLDSCQRKWENSRE